MARIYTLNAQGASLRSGVNMLMLWFLLFMPQALAYIPAMPTNDSTAIQQGTNQSDTSMLSLLWYPNALVIHLYAQGQCLNSNF